MAQGKKSFVLYTDLIHTFKHLSKEQRGEVIMWVLEYTNDLEPEPIEGALMGVIEHIKQQLKRDLIKYEDRAERSRKNGLKGGRPKNPEEPRETQWVKKEPKKPDSDNVTVNDSVTVNVIDIKKEILNSNNWIDQISMKKRRQDVKDRLVEFLNDQELKEELFRPIPEIKKHFINWLDKNKPEVKKTVINNRPT